MFIESTRPLLPARFGRTERKLMVIVMFDSVRPNRASVFGDPNL